MYLTAWAMRNKVSNEAMAELRMHLVGPAPMLLPAKDKLSESAVQTEVRLEASRVGARLWRNNVGAGKLDTGDFIRWGLCNDSAAVNAAVKSSDLIGIRPVLVTLPMVGTTIGQFVSREIKKSGWKYAGTKREEAQLAWIKIILGLGGDACFASGPGSIK